GRIPALGAEVQGARTQRNRNGPVQRELHGPEGRLGLNRDDRQEGRGHGGAAGPRRLRGPGEDRRDPGGRGRAGAHGAGGERRQVPRDRDPGGGARQGGPGGGAQQGDGDRRAARRQ